MPGSDTGVMGGPPTPTRRDILVGIAALVGAGAFAGPARASEAGGASPLGDPRRALIVVDVQVDFCEGGSLAVAGGAAVAVAISRHLATKGDRYGLIVATRDWHIDPGAHFSATPDYVDSWPVHCRAGTNGARFHPGLDRFVDFKRTVDVIVSKGHYSAAYSGFEGVDERDRRLEGILQRQKISSVDVVGIATDHCVRATVLDALEVGLPVRLLADMTAGVSPESTRKALKEMRRAGARIIANP